MTRSVDLRTRTAADVRTIDAADFFAHELPGRRAPGADQLGLRPFALEIDGRAWTLTLDGDRVAVEPGDARAVTVVRLDASAFADIVNDLVTPMAFLTAGELDLARGRFEDFLDWWVALRSVLDDRPVHTRGAVDFHDRDGAPLDLTRAFTTDADPDEIVHFLTEAGFVHLVGVFDEAEMAAVSADMDAAEPTYRRGDGRSWWAHTADGRDRVVRMQYFDRTSPALARLLTDERLLRFTRMTGDGHRFGKPGGNQNLAEALVKPIGVVDGISDVPWHKDCSLGSHSYRCCSLTVGISVTGADAESGQLRVVAGSHRALTRPALIRDDLDLPQVDLPTRTGDVTIHLSCTLHMSQPPVVRERRVVYTDFCLFAANDDDPGEARIRRARDDAYRTVSQPSAVGGDEQ